MGVDLTLDEDGQSAEGAAPARLVGPDALGGAGRPALAERELEVVRPLHVGDGLEHASEGRVGGVLAQAGAPDDQRALEVPAGVEQHALERFGEGRAADPSGVVLVEARGGQELAAEAVGDHHACGDGEARGRQGGLARRLGAEERGVVGGFVARQFDSAVRAQASGS